MKFRGAVFSALLAFAASTTNAADWYPRASAKTEMIEQDASGAIILGVNTWNNGGAAVPVSGHNGTCNITAIRLVPPAGREKDWLAMVLAATMSGNAISVYGECSASTWQIIGTRILVEY
jgi:hypothetical protein